MHDQLDLSVVVVNFNAGDVLLDSVDSVLSAGAIATEVIVIDNASSDVSLAGLEARHGNDPRLRIIRNSDNRGFAAASNQGLVAARAEFGLLLNPDCVVEPGALEEVISTMRSRSDAGMAGCLILNPDGSEQRGCRRRLPRVASSIKRVLLGRRGARRGFDQVGAPLPEEAVEVEAISGAFMLVRRSALDAIGLLDEGYFLHCEDLDWCRRFADSGWNILFVPAARAWHQQGHSSSSRPVRVLWYKHRGMWRYFRKFDAASQNALLTLLVWLGIHIRAAILTPLVAVRWLKP